MGTSLVAFHSAGAMLFAGQKAFERDKKIRTQPSLLAADRIQISVFKQTRKKFLDQVLCFFASKALPPDKSVERSPISSTKYFECFLRGGRVALRLQYYAPMSGGE